jgi:heat shock protein HtpX
LGGQVPGSRVAVARNLLKAWLLFAVPAGGLGFVGWQLGDYRLALLFGGSVFLLAAVLYWYADRIAMGMVGARELLPTEAPALHTEVERLSARAAVVKPKLYVLPDGYPRALSAGRGAQGGAAFAISTGLLGVATPAELEGIVAHELAHLRNRDVLVQTLAVTIAAAVIELSRIGGWFQRGFLFVLGPLAASFVHLVLSPRREYEADRFAAELCDSPHGLADGLVRLEVAMGLVAFQASPATEPLYTANPFAEEGLAALFVTHPPLGERVRRLRALDPDWREKLRAA